MHSTSKAPIIISSSEKHHGIALWPPPSSDPKDPLRWPRRVKVLATVSVCLFNFVGNFAGAGFSVATPVLEAQYRKTPSQVNSLLTFNFLLLGIGNMIWVPLAIKLGKRFSLLTSMALLLAVLLWTANAKSFSSLFAARCISGLAASAGESIVPGIVSDLFFLHERAGMMSTYVILTSSATAIGPLIAGFVVADTVGTWRTFSYICAGLAGLDLFLIYLTYPESTYHRTEDQIAAVTLQTLEATDEKLTNSISQIESLSTLPQGCQHVQHVDMDWPKVWLSIIRYDHSISFLKAFTRPLLCLMHLDVLWAVFVYGTALASQVILIFAFPSLLLAPPYLFKPTEVGLIQIAALIGFLFACFGGGYLSDIITTRRIIKEKGRVYPEQRLLSLIPACWVAPIGCIIIAFSCAQKLHWVAIAFGFAMVSFGTVYSPNIAITYVVEKNPASAIDSLVIINVFKNVVAFILLFVAVDWVHDQGWIQVYMIMFMLTCLSTLLAVPLYLFFGRGWRGGRWAFVERVS